MKKQNDFWNNFSEKNQKNMPNNMPNNMPMDNYYRLELIILDYIKKILPYVLAVMAGAWVGFYIGSQYYPRVETKTVAVDKPIYIQGSATSETKTQIAYVPKENIIERYIDSTGKEITITKPEDTVLDAQIGKSEFNVRLNGFE